MSHAPLRLRSCSLLAVSLRRAAARPRPIATVLGALVLLAVPKPVTAFERIGSIELESGEAFLDSAVIDPAGAFAYFGTDTTPGRVVKIDLASFARVGALELESGENDLQSAVIDPAGEFAYFTSADRVVKIDLEAFARVDALQLPTTAGAAVIDPAGGFAYFGTISAPAQVHKVDLESFELIDTMELESGENNLRSAVIDPAGAFAYFGTNTIPGQVVKIDLANFVRVGAIALGSDEMALFSAVIDPAGAFAYFGTNTIPGQVVKIDLEDFERVGAIGLESGEIALLSAVIDPDGAFAYFGTLNAPGRVVKIDLASFAPVGALELEDGESGLLSALIDPVGVFAYFGTATSPGRVAKIGLLPAPELAFDPASLDFGDVLVGETSVPQMAMLSNTGDADATGVTFSGLPANGFDADTSACGDTLPVGASCEVSVTFTPAKMGPASAVLTAASDEEVTAELELAGNGVGETEVFTPVALAADPEPLMALSDGNGLFEPGERVLVAPAWRNDGMFSQLLTGTASGFTGPAGPNYTLVDSNVDYGTVEPQAVSSCLDLEDCYEMEITTAGAPRPAPHWDAAFDETLSDETTMSWTLHVGDSFEDVPRENPFYRFIENLIHNSVTAGCTATEYCPGSPNTRGQMAIFVLRSREGPEYMPPPCEEDAETFDDVPFDNPFCPWIEELAERGVVSGCDEDRYCPGDSITRAQMAIFLLKTLEGSDYVPPECTGVFTDVPCPSLFADWIEDLSVREITSGCSETEYCPSEPQTRSQMAVFLTRTFGLLLYGP